MQQAKTESPYQDHLRSVSTQWDAAMAAAGIDAVIVTAGEAENYFLDDQAPPHKLNPHFLLWCPSVTAAGSALLIRAGRKPGLFFLRPDDFWHQPPELPVWSSEFEVRTYADRTRLLQDIQRTALQAGNHIALIGDSGSDLLDDIPSEDVNPAGLLNQLHYGRARKTAFELDCMRLATAKAVCGHQAAASAFEAGGSELQINLAYLAASEQLPAELPYPSIVALNEHAGVLHYQHYDRTAPANRESFLIDAGGSHNGYAADITRTYAADPDSLFAELIARLDAAQQALIASISGEIDYLELHIDMHRRLAGLLSEAGIIIGSADAAFESGLTETFLPHGLGHLIGLQTHDVGGQQSTAEGAFSPPPANYPSLRLTRTLESDMPVTIEPGLYFIPQLLKELKAGPHTNLVVWSKVESLISCGGIRIEDNIVLREGQVENLTRDAFARLAQTRTA